MTAMEAEYLALQTEHGRVVAAMLDERDRLKAQLAAKDAAIAGLVGAARKAYTAMSANDPFSLTVWTEGVDALEAALALAADATKEGRNV